MNRDRVVRLLIAAAGLMLLASVPARAQNGGLFGATRPSPPDRFNFMVDVSEGHENELSPEFRQSVSSSDLHSGGFSTLFGGSADYAHQGRRVQWGATGSSAFKHYQRINRFAPVSHTVGLGATIALLKRTSIQLNQTAAYAPSYLYDLFPIEALLTPGESIPADPDYRLDESASQSYATSVVFRSNPVERTRVTATADYRHTRFDRETVSRFDNTFYSAGANLSRSVTRNVEMKAGYQFRTAEFRPQQFTREHSGSVGLQYSRPLSRTRRVSYHLDISPASVGIPAETLAEIAQREGITSTALDDKVFRLQVDGSIDYDVYANWKLIGTYSRGVEYLAILTEPIFSDGVRLGLTGQINQRLDLSSTAGYATGQSTAYGGGDNLETYTGNVRLRYAINRPLAVYSEYVYYHYDMKGQARLAPSLPRAFEQHVVRIGVMFFTSLNR